VLTVEDKMKTTLYLGSSRRDDLVTLDSAITNKTDQIVRLKRDSANAKKMLPKS